MASVFRGTLEFFNDLGIYDVVLPFLLVFTVVFAILEKTKAFGVDKIEGGEVTKKNLNAMFAFVAAFIVVASSQLVTAINMVVGQVFLLLLFSIMFLLLAGSFGKDEQYMLEGAWQKFFMALVFIGVVLIFMNAFGWLQAGYNFVMLNLNSTAVSSIILLVVVVLFMGFITRTPKTTTHKEGE